MNLVEILYRNNTLGQMFLDSKKINDKSFKIENLCVYKIDSYRIISINSEMELISSLSNSNALSAVKLAVAAVLRSGFRMEVLFFMDASFISHFLPSIL